jgi:hypothetical protein
MAPFVVTHDTPLSPDQAWARITDWPTHARFVPLTRIEVTTPPPNGVGTRFTARTAVGKYGFDDIMEIVEWTAPADGQPGRCRLEKRGRAIQGWAELSVEAHGSGSRATWREEARPAKLPKFADRASAASGRLLFGRVLRKLLDG